jgi:endonuclease/exonuclease/phosphatase family metal-dependent hydrolase
MKSTNRIWCLAGKIMILAFLALTTMAVADDSTISRSTIRLLTYNIHHGEGIDNQLDIGRIARLIVENKVDIACLQEVDRGATRTQKRDLPQELSLLTHMQCIFSNNYHFQGGEYGNAILTRYPIACWTNIYYPVIRPGEQRGLLVATLSINGKPLTLMNTHLDHRSDDIERLPSVDFIFKQLEVSPKNSTLVCGDFNDTPQSKTYEKMSLQFDDIWLKAGKGEGYTIPNPKVNKRIDYIWFLRSVPVVPVKAEVMPSLASDHLGVIADFQLP